MKICIVEDDINYRKSLEIAFNDCPDYEIKSFKNAREALKAIHTLQHTPEDFDVIITDINMPQMDGLQFLHELEGKYTSIVITGNASVQNAIKAIRLGVKDFLVKGFSFEELVQTLENLKKEREVLGGHNGEHLGRSGEIHKKPKESKGESKTESKASKTQASKVETKFFIASSPALESAKSIALKVAPTDANVFLMGQSGVGKDVFANFIHAHSKRANAPFIAINMAAIPEHLLESELFGYEKGAFTDATSAKPGILEDANGGSVFLDEIGEMPIALQAKLLRVLQEKTLTRLGSSKKIPIDVRFISATNANIMQKIAQGSFREDLFFRLQTIPIFVPPLKERKEEILDIARYKLQETAQKYGFAPKVLSAESEAALLNYPWYGNVRELLSVIERAVILSEGESITPKDLFLESRQRVFGSVGELGFEELEREFLAQALSRSEGDVQKASDLLGMDTGVLRHKKAHYGL
ncbi:sigma-54-dependent transcriptional regulator [uncultured Helicobacter sp.]|uniref:sigma-54-dependent transcriptional regulator n=1 Tax=uncultured Helicobacter sp. TaxID=175537 RepID=UPI00374EC678